MKYRSWAGMLLAAFLGGSSDEAARHEAAFQAEEQATQAIANAYAARARVSLENGIVASQQTRALYPVWVQQMAADIAGKDTVLLSEQDADLSGITKQKINGNTAWRIIASAYESPVGKLYDEFDVFGNIAQYNSMLLSPAFAVPGKSIFVNTEYFKKNGISGYFTSSSQSVAQGLDIPVEEMLAMVIAHEARHISPANAEVPGVLAEHPRYDRASFPLVAFKEADADTIAAYATTGRIDQKSIESAGKARKISMFDGSDAAHMTGPWYGRGVSDLDAFLDFQRDADVYTKARQYVPHLRAAFEEAVYCGLDTSALVKEQHADWGEITATDLTEKLADVRPKIHLLFNILPESHPLGRVTMAQRMAQGTIEADKMADLPMVSAVFRNSVAEAKALAHEHIVGYTAALADAEAYMARTPFARPDAQASTAHLLVK